MMSFYGEFELDKIRTNVVKKLHSADPNPSRIEAVQSTDVSQSVKSRGRKRGFCSGGVSLNVRESVKAVEGLVNESVYKRFGGRN
jgi:hypothetical protein